MAGRCGLMEELDSATCFLLPPHPHFVFLSSPYIFLVLPFHLSRLYPPLPTESYLTVKASMQLNLISFVLGTAIVLSVSQPFPPLSPAGPSSSQCHHYSSHPPLTNSCDGSATKCSNWKVTGACYFTSAPSILEQSTRKVPLRLPRWCRFSHCQRFGINMIVMGSILVLPRHIETASRFSEMHNVNANALRLY